jgi:hypothetical protein
MRTGGSEKSRRVGPKPLSRTAGARRPDFVPAEFRVRWDNKTRRHKPGFFCEVGRAATYPLPGSIAEQDLIVSEA